MEEITNQLEEGLSVKFTEEELHEVGKDFKFAAVIKLVVNRGFNRAALKTVLIEIWKSVDDGVSFTEVEGNVLIARFNNEVDRNKALHQGPWRFMGISSREMGYGEILSELFSAKLQLWIQIHNLPVEYSAKMFAIRFTEKAGKVIETSENNQTQSQKNEIPRDVVRKYIKFRVEIDLQKPIVPGWTLDRGGSISSLD